MKKKWKRNKKEKEKEMNILVHNVKNLTLVQFIKNFFIFCQNRNSGLFLLKNLKLFILFPKREIRSTQ